MSREVEKARRLLAKRLSEVGAGGFYAKITSVDIKARTCKVDIRGTEYEQVMLYSVEQPDSKGLCIIPAEGSTVLVEHVAGSERLYVTMFSVVDEVLLTIGETTLKVTDKGTTITRDSSGLKKTLSDLCDAIVKLTVTTNVGQSGVPINAADFTKIKDDLNNYLEG